MAMGRLISRLSPILQRRLSWDAAAGATSCVKTACTRSKDCYSLSYLLPGLSGSLTADFSTSGLIAAGRMHMTDHRTKVCPHHCQYWIQQCSGARGHCRHLSLGIGSQAGASHSVTGVLSPEEVNTRLDFTPQLSKLQASMGLCTAPQQHAACRRAQHNSHRSSVAKGQPVALHRNLVVRAVKLLCFGVTFAPACRAGICALQSAIRRAVMRRADPAGCCQPGGSRNFVHSLPLLEGPPTHEPMACHPGGCHSRSSLDACSLSIPRGLLPGTDSHVSALCLARQRIAPAAGNVSSLLPMIACAGMPTAHLPVRSPPQLE